MCRPARGAWAIVDRARAWHNDGTCCGAAYRPSWYSSRSARAQPAVCVRRPPHGRSFQFPARSPTGRHERSENMSADEADRGPGPHQEPRDAAGRGHVRPARRGHPARLRPDPRLVDPPHPGPPRAGRRPHGRGLRPGHRPARRGHGDERARGPPTSSRRCADAYMDSIPMVVITGQVATAAIGTDAFQECDITGITDGHHQAQLADHRRRTTSPGWSPRPSTWPPPAAPARCSSTSPRTSPTPRWSGTGRLGRRARPARLPAR